VATVLKNVRACMAILDQLVWLWLDLREIITYITPGNCPLSIATAGMNYSDKNFSRL